MVNPILLSGQCTDFLLTKNGHMAIGIRAEITQQLGQVICGQILAFQDKSTMNLFAIDSRGEVG
jgi:hypothetical protein